ncbi:MAG: hypothetical protein WBB23_17380 [Desulforhopalus sp.]
MAGMCKYGLINLVKVFPEGCLDSVNMVWIRDALSSGMDGDGFVWLQVRLRLVIPFCQR